MLARAEYIWLDGASDSDPTQKLRSKTRVIEIDPEDELPVILKKCPEWSYDGSSTNQADGDDSDVVIKPVNIVYDPSREDGVLVMCETFMPDGTTPHPSNPRAKLREVLENKSVAIEEPQFGFEQEYFLMDAEKVTPLGWTTPNGFAVPQGPFYCGVGPAQIKGRDFAEAHTEACMEAGVMIYGINAEVAPAQWEFQIGPRGVRSDDMSALNICDHVWFARWLMYRIGENFDLEPSIEVKPIKGDWNGSGMHTNFSTKTMREGDNAGSYVVEHLMPKFEAKHTEHIAVYGNLLSERLTGLHETCDINTFKFGESDRTSSIRIPPKLITEGNGYIEDRRPGANADPYKVATRILQTTFDLD